jgi:hypothetical protein
LVQLCLNIYLIVIKKTFTSVMGFSIIGSFVAAMLAAYRASRLVAYHLTEGDQEKALRRLYKKCHGEQWNHKDKWMGVIGSDEELGEWDDVFVEPTGHQANEWQVVGLVAVPKAVQREELEQWLENQHRLPHLRYLYVYPKGSQTVAKEIWSLRTGSLAELKGGGDRNHLKAVVKGVGGNVGCREYRERRLAALCVKWKKSYSLGELKDAGFAYELTDAGFTARELKDAGFTARGPKDAGLTAREPEDAGSTAQELKDAGSTVQELHCANF